MKTIKDLTSAIFTKIPSYQEKALEGVSDGTRYKNFNFDKAKACVDWNYTFCGFTPPKFIFVAENPLEMQLMFNMLGLHTQLDSQLHSQLDSQLESQLYSQLHSQLESQLRLQLNSQLRSQLGLQLNLQLYSQLESQLRSQLGLQLNSQLYLQLYSQLYSQLHSQLESQLHSQLRSQLDSQLRSQLHSQLDSQLDSQLGSQLDSQLGSQLEQSKDNLFTYTNQYFITMNFYSDCFYTWYEFIRAEFNLPLSINDDFQKAFALQRESGISQILISEEFAVICKYPKEVHWKGTTMHNLEGVAVEWGFEHTPFECYYINGRNLPKETFFSIKNATYTPNDLFQEKNEEYKSTAISMIQELYGDSYLVEFFGEQLKQVDTYTDKKSPEKLVGTTNNTNIGVYTLFKGTILDEEVAYIRCYCPSTDRMFFLGVESIFNNAKDAIASLYRVPKKLKTHIKYIQRQGERFSTVFDVFGTNLLKNSLLSKEDIQETETISGDEYFEKMQYEY